MSTTCVFCEIAGGYARADIVFQTNDVLCLLPLEMEVDGHVVLMPKAHHETLFDIPADVLAAVMMAAKQAGILFTTSLNATGVNLLHASGKSAQQSVTHFHIHLLPRFESDGIDAWPSLPGSRQNRAELLSRLRAEQERA